MATNEDMTINERYKYLRKMQKRYGKADRKSQGRLLDEMEEVTGLHRKSLIRLLAGKLERRGRGKQRGRRYGPDVDDALRVISESMDHICAERLTPNLSWLARHLAEHGELKVTAPLLAQLDAISVATVKRILARIRQDEPRLRRSGPKQRGPLWQEVPIKRLPWDIQTPGYFEVDTVFHCGISVAGDYLCTLQMIDVATGWSERLAVLGRSYRVMENAFQRILHRLPFPILELHSDNGSEFINNHLLRFWKRRAQPVSLSRSRPFRKNDNRFVEQKNSTLVRTYLGHERLDTVQHALAVNHLYDLMWVYYNLFQPVMRTVAKEVIPQPGQPAKIIRRYDQPRTPFDRLCATDAVPPYLQTRLHTLRQQTNPRQLRQAIYDQIDTIFALPGAVSGTTESIFDTLLPPTNIFDLNGYGNVDNSSGQTLRVTHIPTASATTTAVNNEKERSASVTLSNDLTTRSR